MEGIPRFRRPCTHPHGKPASWLIPSRRRHREEAGGRNRARSVAAASSYESSSSSSHGYVAVPRSSAGADAELSDSQAPLPAPTVSSLPGPSASGLPIPVPFTPDAQPPSPPSNSSALHSISGGGISDVISGASSSSSSSRRATLGGLASLFLFSSSSAGPLNGPFTAGAAAAAASRRPSVSSSESGGEDLREAESYLGSPGQGGFGRGGRGGRGGLPGGDDAPPSYHDLNPDPNAGRPRRITSKRVPLVTLPCGLRVSKIIRGCWQLGGLHRGDRASDRTVDSGEVIMDLERFFRAGMTTLDTSESYGPSDMLIGQYLRLNPALRDEVQVLSQINVVGAGGAAGGAVGQGGGAAGGGISRDMLEYRVRAAMKRMGQDKLDLVQLHWADFKTGPGASRGQKKSVKGGGAEAGGGGLQGGDLNNNRAHPKTGGGYLDAVLWLQEMKEEGLISHIGLVNFDTPRLIEVLDQGVQVASNQVQYSVLDRRPELFMAGVCVKKGVALLPHGVLAGGFLSDTFHKVPANQAVLNTASKQMYGSLLRQRGGWTYMQEVLQTLSEIASKHRVSISAVALRWVLDQQGVGAAIIGARNAEHIRDLRVAVSDRWSLDEDDNLAIDAAYEGGGAQPAHDVFVWERGGGW